VRTYFGVADVSCAIVGAGVILIHLDVATDTDNDDYISVMTKASSLNRFDFG
jgi:hypothetical protein